MKEIAVRSPTSSLSKIGAELMNTSKRGSGEAVSMQLRIDFGLKSHKPAAKPRLTDAMKQKRLNFARRYRNWTVAEWSKVLYSDESCIVQSNPRKRHVRRSVGMRYDVRYTIQMMKHPPSHMIWSAIHPWNC